VLLDRSPHSEEAGDDGKVDCGAAIGSGEKGEAGGDAQRGVERDWKSPRRSTRGIAQRMVSRRR
jgi:hypothetical protein